MNIVLDTNILLVSIPKRSRYRCIFDALLEKRFTLLISHDILTEYEEIIGSKTTPQIAANIVEMLLTLRNVKKVDIFFKWQLIEADPDDNKFTDCAIAETLISLSPMIIISMRWIRLSSPKFPA